MYINQPNTDTEAAILLAESTSINKDELDLENEKVPSQLAYYSTLYSTAIDVELEADLEVTKVEATMREKLRQGTALAGNGKKLTVDELDSKVYMSSEWLNAKRAHNKAKANKERLKGIVNSINVKAEMLVSMSANRRSERRNNLDPR